MRGRLRFFAAPSVELTGKQIKVGVTESDFKGLLTFIRSGRDTFKLEATHLWFEFDDETYDQMIPEEIDTGSASDANISSSLIRGYVRRHAEFSGSLRRRCRARSSPARR